MQMVLDLDGHMEVDTGAAVSIMSEKIDPGFLKRYTANLIYSQDLHVHT